MDKDDKKHLEEYKREETFLTYRLKVVKALIKPLEDEINFEKSTLSSQINETTVKSEHDFPNFKKYSNNLPKGF